MRVSGKLMLWGLSVTLLLGCSRRLTPGHDPFDMGTQPLKLLPAPGGLCGGDGAQRECSTPGGCAVNPTAVNPAAGNPSLPGQNAGTGFAPPANESPLYDGSHIVDSNEPFGGSPADYFPEPPLPDPEPIPLPPLVPVDAAFDAGPGGRNDAGGIRGGAEPSRSDAGEASMSPLDGGMSLLDGGVTPSTQEGNTPTSGERRVRHLGSALTDQCSAGDQTRPATRYLSADDSNSMASPVVARRLIRSGQLVPGSIIRPYEFLNYYDFSFDPAAPGEVRIVPQLSSCPVDGELNLQVALQAERRDPKDRAPLNLTWVIDTSGSMQGAPLELAKAAVSAMSGQLQQGDRVSLIFWNTVQDVRIDGHEVNGPSDPLITRQLQQAVATGGTDLYAGLVKGYEIASANRGDDRINRVIMISDGGANVGVTNAELIAGYADDEDGVEGIYLAGIGVGAGVNDQLMNSVTDAGRGAYVYLDSAEEAQRMLGERFLQVVDVAAREVRLELTLPWYMQVTKFYGEQISFDRSKVKPQHLSPNSAMVFFQVLEACDPSLLHGDDRIRLTATWTRPFSREKRSTTLNTTLNQLAGDDREIEKAAVITGYAEALAVADRLPAVDARALLQSAYDDVVGAHRAAEDPDLIEVAGLLETYARRFGGLTLDMAGAP